MFPWRVSRGEGILPSHPAGVYMVIVKTTKGTTLSRKLTLLK